MYIKELTLKNFRNYKNLFLEFSPGVNLIEGPNAAGKTNILEAISVISGLKSFRNISDQDMIKWGENSYFCSSVMAESPDIKFEIGFSFFHDKSQKKAKIDGIAKKTISDYYGKFLTVIFSPEDIFLVTGPPEVRRRYFDSIISKTDREYLSSLGKYKRILISRNKLLRDIREKKKSKPAMGNMRTMANELEVWDNMLAKQASEIIRKRDNFLTGFNPSFINAYQNISETDDPPKIQYISVLKSSDEENIIQELKRRREKDIILASTQAGPHRDDFVFLFKEDLIYKYYASQGQKRTASVALKITEYNYLKNATSKMPVILIDDIFGELDDKRRKKMMDNFKENGQIIITALNSGLVPSYENDIRKFYVSSGAVSS
jgi:DNA replication and repair protein RecF